MKARAPWAAGVAAVTILIAWPRTLTSQSPAPAIAFDAASVKESSTLELDGLFRTTPGRFTVTNLSVRWIVRYAFRLRDYQVVGAPAWTDTRYNITATFANASATDDAVRTMLQRLLAERFALRAHREQRNIPLYSLVRSRADGLGPKLTPSAVDCTKPPAGGAVPPAAGQRAQPTCTMFQTAWFIRGFARTMPQLAQVLDAIVGSPVADKTGLSGGYDVDLQWGEPTAVAADPSIQSPESIASLLTALQEQLGLKLEASRGPHDVLVIDSISRPTAD